MTIHAHKGLHVYDPLMLMKMMFKKLAIKGNKLEPQVSTDAKRQIIQD